MDMERETTRRPKIRSYENYVRSKTILLKVAGFEILRIKRTDKERYQQRNAAVTLSTLRGKKILTALAIWWVMPESRTRAR